MADVDDGWADRREGDGHVARDVPADLTDGPPDGPAPGTRDEQALRALLERAVPRVPAPEERMLRVRQRVVRGRRLRVAGVAVATVGVVAVASLSGLLRGGSPGTTSPAAGTPPASLAPPAASARPSPTSPTAGSATTTSTPTGARGLVTHWYPDLAGLTVLLPRGWKARTVRGMGKERVGFGGTRGMPSRDLPCPEAKGYCMGRAALKYRGDGVVVFRLENVKEGAVKSVKDGTFKTEPKQLVRVSPSASCRVAGGTTEFRGWRAVGKDEPWAAVVASACLHEPSGLSVREVVTVLRSATFRTGRAPTSTGQQAGPAGRSR